MWGQIIVIVITTECFDFVCAMLVCVWGGGGHTCVCRMGQGELHKISTANNWYCVLLYHG